MGPAVPSYCLGMYMRIGHRPASARSAASTRLPGGPGLAALSWAWRTGLPHP